MAPRRSALPSAHEANHQQHGYYRDGDHEKQDEDLEWADPPHVPENGRVALPPDEPTGLGESTT